MFINAAYCLPQRRQYYFPPKMITSLDAIFPTRTENTGLDDRMARLVFRKKYPLAFVVHHINGNGFYIHEDEIVSTMTNNDGPDIFM